MNDVRRDVYDCGKVCVSYGSIDSIILSAINVSTNDQMTVIFLYRLRQI